MSDITGNDGSVFNVTAETAELAERAIVLEQPAGGEIAEYQIEPGQPLRLTFSLDDVDVEQTENDIIISFADGSQIILNSLVDAAFSEEPPILLLADGGTMSAEELIEATADLDALADALQGVDTASGESAGSPVTSYGSRFSDAIEALDGFDRPDDIFGGSEPDPIPGPVPNPTPDPDPEPTPDPEPNDPFVEVTPPPLVAYDLDLDLGAPPAFDAKFAGDDFLDAADFDAAVFGGGGDDVIEGTTQDDVLYGDGQSVGEFTLDIETTYTETTDGVVTDVDLNSPDVTIVVTVPEGVTVAAPAISLGDNQWQVAGNQINDVVFTSDADVDEIDISFSATAPFVAGAVEDSFTVTINEETAGDDTIDGGSGDDEIYGQEGDDTLEGGSGEDVIRGGIGNDNIDGGSGADKIYGEDGDDVLDGGSGDDSISGGIGDDTIDGGSGDDLIDGGAGDDFIEAGSSDDTVGGGIGSDEIYGESGDDTLLGEAGDDELYGGKGSDALDGGTGIDTVDAGEDDDVGKFTVGEGGVGETYAGGEGTDTLLVSYSADDLSDPAIVADLVALKQFIADNSDASSSDGPSETFDAIGLTVKDWEDIEFDGPAVDVSATVNVGLMQGDEDTAIAIDVSATLTTDNGAAEVTSYTFSGAGDAQLSAGTYDADTGTWTVDADDIAGLTITPVADSDANINLSVVANVTNLFTDEVTSTSSEAATVIVEAVADQPNLSVNDASGNEDTAIDLDFSAVVTDTDGSEAITSYSITGVPSGATLSAGTYDADTDSWTLTPAEVAAGVSVTPAADSAADFTLNVTATTTDKDTETGETSTATSSGQIKVTVDAVAEAADLDVENVSGNEDTAIALDIAATTDDGSVITTYTITGAGDAQLSAGTYDADTGTWTVDAADIADLKITPVADSDANINLSVVVNTKKTDPETGEVSTASSEAETVTVAVNAVADKPNLSVNDASGNEDTAIDLDFSAVVTDTDGSEAITSYSITGVPSGATLSAGTYDADTDTWTLTPAEVAAGVSVTPAADSAADFTLNVTATTTDKDTETGETSTATSSGQIKVTVDAVAEAADLDVENVSGNEDTAIALDIGATTDDGSVITTYTITGAGDAQLSAGTYDADTGTWTVDAADIADLTITPVADSDANINLSVVVNTEKTDPETGEVSTASSEAETVTVTVNAVADKPNLSVNDASGDEDTAIDLDFSAVVTDTDGSEAITSYSITGVPSGATLSAGTYDADTDTWTLTPAEVAAGVSVTPAADSAADFTLNVTATTTDKDTETGETSTATSSGQIKVTVDAVAEAADLDVENVSGNEDTAIALDIAATTDDGSVITTYTITGAGDAQLSAGTYDADTGTWTVDAADIADLTITPVADSDANINLSVVVNTEKTDPETGEVSTASSEAETVTVTVNAVADKPNLSVNDASGDEDTAIDLDFSAVVTDTDGSEAITSYSITGVPSGATLSAGTYDADTDTWTLTPAEVAAGVSVTPAADSAADFTLNVTATTTDKDTETGETSTATSSGQIKVTVDAVAEAADLDVENVSGNEDTAIALDIAATTDDGSVITTYTITGAGDAQLSAGTYDADTGTWTVDAADIADLKITPVADSDANINLSVVVNTKKTDPETGEVSTASSEAETVTVTVNAVADKPNLSVNDASGDEDTAIDLDFSAVVTDTDGSEAITSYSITGVPSGATLSAGTYDADTDTWTLTPAEVAAGVSVTPAADSAADFTLNVTATTTDKDTETGETSTATSSGQIKVTVDAVAEAADLDVENVSGNEDTAIALDIAATTDDGSVITTYTITGAGDAQLSAGTYDADTGTWTVDAADIADLKITPVADSDANINLSVVVNTKKTDPETGEVSTASSEAETVTVAVNAVADKPNLSVNDASGNEDTAIDLDFSAVVTDTDGSEAITSYSITGVPSGATLSAGTYDADTDTWTLTPAEVAAGVSVTPAADSAADFTLNVTATTTDKDTETGETSTATSSGQIKVTVDAVAEAADLDVENVSGNEDTAIALDIGATTDDGSVITTYTITGAGDAQLSAGTYDADTGTWTVDAADIADLKITPVADSDANINLSVVVNTEKTDPETKEVSTASSEAETVTVTVNAVADKPNLSVNDASGDEDTAIDLDFSAVVTDTDGSEAITSYSITGVPSGATLSAGTYDADTDTWTLTPAEVAAGVSVTPAADSAADFTLNVTATTTDKDTETGETSTATSSGQIKVTVDAVAEAADLDVENVSGNEDTAIALDIAATTDDGSVITTYTITGAGDAQLSAGTYDADTGTWTVDAADIADLKITPVADSDANINLSVVVNTKKTDPETGEVSTASSEAETVTVAVNAVADKPNLSVNDASGNEDTAIDLDFSAVVTDTDGSEAITSYSITGVPSGATLSAGTYDADTDTWTLTPAEVAAGVSVTPAADSAADFTLNVTATTTDKDTETGETSTATSSGQIKVTVDAVAEAADLDVENVSGNEDTAIALDIGATTDDGSVITTYTITGAGDAQLSAGTYDADTGTWTVDAADIADLTITPVADSDANINLSVVVNTEKTDPETGEVSTASSEAETVTVTVNAVADKPNLSVNDASGDEDTAIDLDFSAVVTDTDGSEAITSYSITGVPSGATLSAGTYDADTDTWTLTPAEVAAGVSVTPAADSAADFTLNVTATTTDKDTETGETSTATSSGQIKVTVDAVAEAADLDVENVSGNEDTAIALDIGATTDDGSVITTYTITGAGDAQLSAGTYDADTGTWTVDAADIADLKITPAAHDADDFELSVVVNTEKTDPDTNEVSTASSEAQTVKVVVNAVADAPNLTVDEDVTAVGDSGEDLVLDGTSGDDRITGGSGNDEIDGGAGNDTLIGDSFEGMATTSLDIAASLKDTDLSETLSITLSGFGIDTVLTNAAGETFTGATEYDLTADQLEGLELSVPIDTANFDITVTATATDSEAAGEVVDASDDVAEEVATISVDVSHMTGYGDDIITGGAGDDYIEGNDGDDVLIGDGELSLGENLIVNGEFEADTPGSWSTFQNIEGWTATEGHIEIQDHGHGGTPVSDDSFLELDAHYNSTVQQAVALTAGSFVLAFQYSGRDKGALDAEETSDFSVSLVNSNGEVVWSESFEDVEKGWQDASFDIEGIEAGDYNLVFSGAGLSDSYGALIDSVSLRGYEVAGDDTLVGGAGDDDISGNAGEDILDGGIGDDTLDGGAGIDTVEAGSGDDTGHFTVGEGGAGEIYAGGEDEDTLVVSYSADDLSDPAIVADLVALKQFIADNSDASSSDGPSETFDAIGLTVKDWEDIEFDGPAVDVSATVNVGLMQGDEDEAIAIDVSATLTTDNGAAEVTSYTFSNIPDGALFNKTGEVNADGSVTFTADQMDGLTITPPSNDDSVMELDVVANVTNLLTDEVTSTDAVDANVNVDAVGDTPNLSVNDASGDEDTAIDLDFSAVVTDTDGSEEITSYTITDVPSGATLSAGTYDADTDTWTLTPAEVAAGVSVTPAADSAADFTLNVTATTTDTDTETGETSTATSSGQINVTVDAVAEAADLDVENVSGNEDTAIALDISAEAADGGEMTGITITGVPSGATLSAGTYDAVSDSWSVDADDIDGLSITPPADSGADMTLSVVAHSEKTDPETGDVTTASTDAETMTVEVHAVADKPTLSVEAPAVETVTIDISNVKDTDADQGFTVSAKNIDGSDGEISINTHPSHTGFGVVGHASGHGSELGSNESGSESISVEFDQDVSSVDVSMAWQNRTEDATVEFYKDGVKVGEVTFRGVTDRIDEAVTLAPTNGSDFDEIVFHAGTDRNDDYLINSISFERSVEPDNIINTDEDTPIELDISAGVTDTDGSESIVNYQISGLPEGAELSAGDYDEDTGIWTVSPDDIDGITLTSAEHSAEDMTLTVTVNSQDVDPETGAIETNSTTAQLQVNVNAVADQPTVSVDENVTATGDAGTDDVLVGTDGDDRIFGGAGDDTIDGGAGNDAIYGDVYEGMATTSLNVEAYLKDTDTSETLSINLSGFSTDAVLINADGEEFTGATEYDLTPDQLDGLELSVPTGTANFDITVTATATDSEADGEVAGATDDDVAETVATIHVDVANEVGAGDDVLTGGSGDDYIAGNAGDDTIIGDGGTYVEGDGGSITWENVRDTDMGFTVTAKTSDGEGGLQDAQISTGNSRAGKAFAVIGTPSAGVNGQLGYDKENEVSEELSVAFDQDVSSATVGISNLYRNEGNRHEGRSEAHEQGKWVAMKDGEVVGEGTFTATQGSNQTELNINIPDGFDQLVFTATEYSGGQETTRDSSDYWITNIDFDWKDPASFDDSLHGGAGEDHISGNLGDDIITGGANDDTIVGGAGSDFIVGGTDDGEAEIGQGTTTEMQWLNGDGTQADLIYVTTTETTYTEFEYDGGGRNANNVNANNYAEASEAANGRNHENGDLVFNNINNSSFNVGGGDDLFVVKGNSNNANINLEGGDNVVIFETNPGQNVNVNVTNGDDVLVLPGDQSDYNLGALHNNNGVYSGQITGPNNMNLTINNFETIKFADSVIGDASLVETTTTVTTEEIDVVAMEASGATLTAVEVEVPGTVTVTFESSRAGYHNSFGYYVKDENGEPTEGVLIWKDLRNETAQGEEYEIEIPAGKTADDIGFFLIPDGDRRNSDLEDGMDVTFQKNAQDEWVVVDPDGDVLKGRSEPAYFDGPAEMNPDGIVHVQIDEDGELGFEDLKGGGDRDYDDAVVTVEVDENLEFDFEGGDQLWGGEEGGDGDGQQDLFFFAEGDGVDTIHDFEAGTDQLIISGYDRDDMDIFADGNDTIIKLGDNGDALKLVDVDASIFGEDNISEYDADTDDSGALSAEELMDMKDDLFKGEGEEERGGNDADIVLVEGLDTAVNIESSEEPPTS
ncbi:DUF4114 domain-containing protein [Curvivirga sp.]|uniref:DUF4114 domain-containing protein n=1 Tax=Curvivirga sp. TaxID=2856848 RepID=UPI003B5B1659